MVKAFQSSLLEKIPMLILLGLLAGAVGGLGIGLVTGRTTSPVSAGR